MKNKNSFILGDVSAIKTKGIEYLFDNYFWPVSDDEFKEFIRYTHDEYLKIVLSIESKDMRNVAIVELSFIAKLQQILHHNYVKNYADDNKVELITSKLSEELYYPNWESISKYYVSLNPLSTRVKGLFRRLAKNVLFNRHVSIAGYIKNFIFGSSVISIGSYDNLKQEFVINKNFFCDHLDAVGLYNNKIINKKQLDDINIRLEYEVIIPYIHKLKIANKKFISNIDFSLLQEVWKNRFSDATRIYLNILNNKKKSCVLVTELSKPIHKLITVAYQELGSSVYCFHHGHDTAVTIHSVGHDITSAHCLKYVVPSYGVAHKYQKVYLHLTTKYYSTESNWYKDIFHKHLCKNNQKINKIMLVGFPLNSIRYVDGESSFFYSRVDLEYRLIVFLKKHGYHVIYKAHPDRLSEATDLYDHVADEIITLPFEKITDMADCFLFTHSSSTTFGYALLTNKPIFLIDIDSSVVDVDSYNLLRKRINMVPSHTVESTRIFFNEDSMLKLLLNPPIDEYDSSYIKKMFFPVKDNQNFIDSDLNRA